MTTSFSLNLLGPFYTNGETAQSPRVGPRGGFHSPSPALYQPCAAGPSHPHLSTLVLTGGVQGPSASEMLPTRAPAGYEFGSIANHKTVKTVVS